MPEIDIMRLTIPSIDDHELQAVEHVLSTGFLTQGPVASEFEDRVKDLIGTKHAFATSSCTVALHLSLVVLGIGPGDEVLVPDFTFPATANVVVQQGAKPVMVDVSPETYNIDVEQIESKINSNTRAIIPVHAFGLSADMGQIMEMSRRHDIAVIEDAACAMASYYHGKACGTIGDLGCFSFHPRKVITTGEGGMIVTDDDQLAQQIALLRSHGGKKEKHYYRYVSAGFNYRMSDINAAIGVAQMDKLKSIVARRRELAELLTSSLSSVPGLILPSEPPGFFHSYQSYVVRVENDLDRDELIESLRARGIETTLGTYSLHCQPYFQSEYHYSPGDMPNSQRLFEQTLTLPLYPSMTECDVASVAASLHQAVVESRR